MFKMQITVPLWVKLNSSTRNTIAEMFDLQKSGCVEVEDGEVKTDGYTNENLAQITPELIKEFTKLDSDDLILQFMALIDLIENPKPLKVEEVEKVKEEIPVEILEVKTNTKNAKTKTKNKGGVRKGNKK